MSKIFGPYLKSTNTSIKMFRNLLISLLPIIVFSIYKNGYLVYKAGKISIIQVLYPLLFILLPALISFSIEVLYSLFFLKTKNKNILLYNLSLFSFLPGLILGLILPINIPIWIVAIGAILVTIIKLLMERFNKKWFNPVLIIYVLIFVVFTSYFQTSGYLNQLEVDRINSAESLLGVVKLDSIGSYEALIKPYGTLMDFFVGIVPGAYGVTSVLLCLVAYIYLVITKSIKWKIPLVYVLTVFFSTFLIGNINDVGMWYPLFHILSGGLVFGAVFIASDSFTSPTTSQGQILYGLFLGILTVIIRYLFQISGGVFISILIMNIFVRFIDIIGAKSQFDFRVSLFPYFVAWVFIIGVGFYVGNIYSSNSARIDNSFSIQSVNTVGTKTTYIVTQDSYNDKIKAEVIINNSKVISYRVLEQKDPNFSKLLESKYLDTLINNQFSLDKVDVLDTNIDTSVTLKKILKNVISNYEKSGIQDNIVIENKDFEIISVDKNESSIIYNVSKKGTSDNIELQIVFIYDIIDQITVLDQNESDFNLIIASNYIPSIISHQQQLDDVETVVGAEGNAEAIKTAVKLTLEDYSTKYVGGIEKNENRQ